MKSSYDEFINLASQKYGVDPKRIQSLITAESNGNPDATSKVGATGLMQLMPGTARDMGVTNIRDPQQNIMGGTKYWAQLDQKYHDPMLDAAGYNYGPGNLDRAIAKAHSTNYQDIAPFLPKETQNYVPKVVGDLTGQNMASNQGQPMAVAPASIPAPVSDDKSQIRQLMAAMGIDPQLQKRQARGQIIDAALTGLGAAIGGLNRRNGGEIQQNMMAGLDQRMALQQKNKQSSIGTMIDLMKLKDPAQTDAIRNYQYALGQGYKGTFEDFDKEMKQAGAFNPTINVGNQPLGVGSPSTGAAPGGMPITPLLPAQNSQTPNYSLDDVTQKLRARGFKL